MPAPHPIAGPDSPTADDSGAPARGTASGAAAETDAAPATGTHPPHRHALQRLALLVALLAAAASSLLLWDPSTMLTAVSGPWRVPLAVAVYGFGTVAFLPRPALNAGVGLLFGPLWGVPVALAGSALGAAVAFGLGRRLGRDALRPLLRGKVLTAIDRRLSEQGFRSVLLVRLFPGAPFQAGNLACAFSGVRFRPYLAGTVLGVVPTTAAYVVAGASAGSPTSPVFLISASVIAVMCVFSAVTLWRARPRRSSS
ncbi:TVP38/TMEM64 family protein [Kitasatospora sp. NPDC088391]|uniref:TVP38/TMEM64 family protein n=1 Tax=Kitasatospora sp. NPDC088391 TaxID=3364074 RepID=UPI00381E1132